MDRLEAMRVFVAVVDAGSFVAASDALPMSKAAVSRHVAELEAHLGVRLLNRTTRQLSLTEVGQAYFREAGEILQRIDDLADSVRDTHREPRGLLRISAPRSFGDAELGHAIMEFLVAQPQIAVDLRLDDRFVDLVEEGFDVAIRVSEPADSSLIARRLAPFRVVTCAAPSWLATHGRPTVPTDLTGLPAIADTNARNWNHWPFVVDGERIVVPVTARLHVNAPQVAATAAEAGLGVARTPLFAVRRAVEEGRLEILLEDYELANLVVHAVYPHRRHLSAKVRVFVDFMVDWFERRKKVGPCV